MPAGDTAEVMPLGGMEVRGDTAVAIGGTMEIGVMEAIMAGDIILQQALQQEH